MRTIAVTAALSLLAAPALAGTRQDSTVLMPEDEQLRAIFEQYGFSEAVVTPDGTIYLSGVVVELGEDGNIDAAYEGVFKYLAGVLARAGASFDDVVEITSFHTDLTSQVSVMSKVKSRHMQKPHPAWTAIQVARLVPDRGITEIKLIAKRKN